MATKSIGHGVALEVSTDDGVTYNPVASINLDGVTGVGAALELIEVTTQDSPSSWREYRPGLLDPVEFSFGIVFDIDDAGTDNQVLLLQAVENKTLYKYQVVLPDGTKVVQFDAYVSGYTIDSGSNDPITANITLRPVGAIDPQATKV